MQLTRFRRRWLVTVMVALVVVLGPSASSLGSDDHQLWPWLSASIGIESKGAHGLWTEGATVTVRWKQRFLSRAEARLELSRDDGRTWSRIGHAPAATGRCSWAVEGPPGAALVRVTVPRLRVRSAPRRVTIVAAVREITFALRFGAALHDDGYVRIWGVLPQGLYPERYGLFVEPTQLPQLGRSRSIAAGGGHLVLIGEDGDVSLWGHPGVASDGKPPIDPPERIAGLADALWARASWGRTFVKLHDGRVFGVGGSGQGVMGDGVNVPEDMPVEITALRDVVDIALGDTHGVALRADGTVLTWGSNFVGQLGDGTVGGRQQPSVVPDLAEVVAIAARLDTSLALDRTGHVWIWGRSQYLRPRTENYGNLFAPYQIPGLERITAIACAAIGGYALRDDGQLFAWGQGGAIGDGSLEDRSAPFASQIDAVERIFVGSATIHTLTSDGRRFGWGRAGLGIVGDGTYSLRPTAFPIRIYSE